MKCTGTVNQIIGELAKQTDTTTVFDCEISKHSRKRSLNANAYYWVLVGKMAEALHRSNDFIHNFMLREYGAFEIIDGKNVYVLLPDTEETEKRLMNAETYHMKPTSSTKEGTDGITYRYYRMLKGSHDYDTQEMTRLIDGMVSEAQMIGIETLTPDELKRLEGYGNDAERRSP